MHEQDPELGRRGSLWVGDAEDAPDPPAVELGDPCRRPRLLLRGEVVDDLQHELLEAAVPAELVRVDLAVGHHHPPQIPGLPEPPDRDVVCAH